MTYLEYGNNSLIDRRQKRTRREWRGYAVKNKSFGNERGGKTVAISAMFCGSAINKKGFRRGWPKIKYTVPNIKKEWREY